MRESNDTRRSANITELVVLKDRENQLKFELEQVKETLKHEQERSKHYLDQVNVNCLQKIMHKITKGSLL